MTDSADTGETLRVSTDRKKTSIGPRSGLEISTWLSFQSDQITKTKHTALSSGNAAACPSNGKAFLPLPQEDDMVSMRAASRCLLASVNLLLLTAAAGAQAQSVPAA